MLCASFVVQTSTGKCFVQALWYKVALGRLTLYTLHSTLHTLHFTHSTLPTPHFTLHTPYLTLHIPHSTLSTPHCRLVTGEICTVSKRCFHACLCALVVSLWTVDQVLSLRRYARTMHEKRFVFLLQRFSLVVQEREYMRVRGFHLVPQRVETRACSCAKSFAQPPASWWCFLP